MVRRRWKQGQSAPPLRWRSLVVGVSPVDKMGAVKSQIERLCWLDSYTFASSLSEESESCMICWMLGPCFFPLATDLSHALQRSRTASIFPLQSTHFIVVEEKLQREALMC